MTAPRSTSDDGRVLYRESHYLAMEGASVLERLVLYRCADGQPLRASAWPQSSIRRGYRI
jgi:hypothetical protein